MNASLSSSSCAKSAGSQLSSARLSVPHGSHCSDADRRIKLLEGGSQSCRVEPQPCPAPAVQPATPMTFLSEVAPRGHRSQHEVCLMASGDKPGHLDISSPALSVTKMARPGTSSLHTRTTGVQRMLARGGGGPRPLDSSNHDAKRHAPPIQERNLGVPSCSAGRSGLAWGIHLSTAVLCTSP